MTTDPMEPLKNLAKKLDEEFEKLGVHMQGFALMPNMDGGPHMAQVIISFDSEALETVDPAQKEIDEQFKMMVRDDARQSDEEKAAEAAAAAQRLAESLEKGTDLLDFDD